MAACLASVEEPNTDRDEHAETNSHHYFYPDLPAGV